MNKIELLMYEMDICRIHADRLTLAISNIEHLYPFSDKIMVNISNDVLPSLDLFTTRLGRLQDTLGEKVFSALLECLEEPLERKSMIDKLNSLERLGILPSVQWWKDLRDLRNTLVYDYPNDPELMAKNLNNAFIHSKRLLVFLETLNGFIDKTVLKDHPQSSSSAPS